MAEKIESKNVYQLIGTAMGRIGAIGKDSAATNNSGKRMYMFRGIDAVYNALNPVMAELGLFFTPEILDQKREERRTSNGGLLIYTILTIRYTLYAPDGSNISMVVTGEGMDSGDKSTNKAMSAALKYAAFQLFMIPTEEMKDPDADVYDNVLPRGAQVPDAVPPVPKVNNTQVTMTAQNMVPTTPPVQAAPPAPPAPPANPVQAYLNKEMEFIARMFGITEKQEVQDKFLEMRMALIKSGTVPNIKSKDLTLEQAQDLMDAIYKNFMSDKKDVKTA